MLQEALDDMKRNGEYQKLWRKYMGGQDFLKSDEENKKVAAPTKKAEVKKNNLKGKHQEEMKK